MTRQQVSFHHVLYREKRPSIDLAECDSDSLEAASRLWFGTTAGNRMRKQKSVDALTKLFATPSSLAERYASLQAEKKAILAIFRRYGGFVSGLVLHAELCSRGLIEPDRSEFDYQYRAQKSPIEDLCRSLLLFYPTGQARRRWDHQSFYGGRRYPSLILLPPLLALVEPAGPPPWRISEVVAPPKEIHYRPYAATALDLWGTTQALLEVNGWKTTREGGLSKTPQTRIRKALPLDTDDPLTPPALESLYYELLRALGATVINCNDKIGRIEEKMVERHLSRSEPEQAHALVRAWLGMRSWQDGIGVVVEKGSSSRSQGLDTGRLAELRDYVAWSLSCLARGDNNWIDLDSYLRSLFDSWGGMPTCYSSADFNWVPPSPTSSKLPGGESQHRRYQAWLKLEGTWAANAILGTMVHLGLVERGRIASRVSDRWGFRLSPLGLAVFGAPERQALVEPAQQTQFLTIQPNHEILAYLDVAEASSIWPLSRIARRTSKGADLVQTFVLTRDSVYQGLESGMELHDVVAFLTQHSRTGLPSNVATSLVEWSRRRETLTLHTNISLELFPAEKGNPPAAPSTRPIGACCLLHMQSEATSPSEYKVFDHNEFTLSRWKVEETGKVKMNGIGSMVRARLEQFTESDPSGGSITQDSIRQAKSRGINLEQIRGWLDDHAPGGVPPLLEVTIGNWTKPCPAFLGEILVLQVTQHEAFEAILNSERFRPMLAGFLPPSTILVQSEHKTAMKRLLKELGFELTGTYLLDE